MTYKITFLVTLKGATVHFRQYKKMLQYISGNIKRYHRTFLVTLKGVTVHFWQYKVSQYILSNIKKDEHHLIPPSLKWKQATELGEDRPEKRWLDNIRHFCNEIGLSSVASVGSSGLTARPMEISWEAIYKSTFGGRLQVRPFVFKT